MGQAALGAAVMLSAGLAAQASAQSLGGIILREGPVATLPELSFAPPVVRLNLAREGQTAPPQVWRFSVQAGRADAALVKNCAGFAPPFTQGMRFEVMEGGSELTLDASLVVPRGGASLAALLVIGPTGQSNCLREGTGGGISGRIALERAGGYHVMPLLTAPSEAELRLTISEGEGMRDAHRPFNWDILSDYRNFHIPIPTPFLEAGIEHNTFYGFTYRGQISGATPLARVSQRVECEGFGDLSRLDGIIEFYPLYEPPQRPSGGYMFDPTLLEQGGTRFSLLAEGVHGERVSFALRAPSGRVYCPSAEEGLLIEAAEPGNYALILAKPEAEGVVDYALTLRIAPAELPEAGDWSGAPSLGVSDYVLGSGPAYLGAGALRVETPIQELTIVPTCRGLIARGAPDAVIDLAGHERGASALTVSALSTGGAPLVALRGEAGDWHCSYAPTLFDEGSNGLQRLAHATVDAPLGQSYEVYVGDRLKETEGTFRLAVSTGSAEAAEALFQRRGVMTDLWRGELAEPLAGRLEFGSESARDPRLPLAIRPSDTPLSLDFGPSCAGMGRAEAPDVTLTLTESMSELLIYMVSMSDGVLAVVGPDNRIHCNDDYQDLHPGVTLRNAPAGDYAIFAGTYRGTGGEATLGVTRGAPVWLRDVEP